MDKISLTGIKAFGYHGVFSEEREKGQDFYVDLELFLNLNYAIVSDDLVDTVNYTELALLTKAIVEGPSCNLIEALAGAVGDEILKKFSLIQRVIVTVHKPQAPMPTEFFDVSVVVERIR